MRALVTLRERATTHPPPPHASPPPLALCCSRERNKVHARKSRERKKAINATLKQQSNVQAMEVIALMQLYAATFGAPFVRTTVPEPQLSMVEAEAEAAAAAADATGALDALPKYARVPGITDEERERRKCV